jgi:hypothetical protein
MNPSDDKVPGHQEMPPPDDFLGALSDDATAVTGNQQPGQLPVLIADALDHRLGYSVIPPQPSAGEPLGGVVASSGHTGTEAGKPSASSFAQLVKSWETYISEAQNADTFQPIQMLQSLRLCGVGHELPRLTLAPSTDFTNSAEGQDPFEPIILRHTHSTPLQYRPSFFAADYDGNGLPPPSHFDATRRSSSTPSRGSAFQQFRASSYGAYMHSAPNIGGIDGRSAFGFPLNRSMYSGVSTESNIRSYGFNPVPSTLSTTQEELREEEKTEIEVMDLGKVEQDMSTIESQESGEVEVQINSDIIETDEDQAKPKTSAAARAARFLSDVGVLRRKKKGARSSIMTVISTASGRDYGEKTVHNDATVETRDKGIPLNRTHGSESAVNRQQKQFNPSASMYHQLDSDVDEEYDRYHIENSGRDSDDRTIPSPDYHPMVDDRPATGPSEDSQDCKSDDLRPAVRIQVSSNIPVTSIGHLSGHACSPNPCQLVDDDPSATPTSSTGSPGGATRSSNTTCTSGHTTQATSTTSTTGNSSSQISETDREVMETIKEGKRRRRQEGNPQDIKNDSDVAVTIDSSSSGSSTANGYETLSGSPGPLRDGASVVADRFFKNSRSPVQHGGYPSCSSVSTVSATVGGSGLLGRARVSSKSRKNNSNGSPTSCSLNSIEETPPTFVSYLDRQAASDLTSLREATEVASTRGDTEEREDSPAQIVAFSAMLLGDAPAVDGQENAMSVFPKLVLPSPEDLYSMLDRFRSRPPRSPAKGLRTMTPTPPSPRLGSPVYQQHQLSPPRKIIDRIDANVSKPYVVRTNPVTQRIILVSPGPYIRPTTPLLCIPVGNPNYSPNLNRPLLAAWPVRNPSPYEHMLNNRTYEEHSIEILKKDSKDEMICQRFSSPETVASAN